MIGNILDPQIERSEHVLRTDTGTIENKVIIIYSYHYHISN